MKCSGYWVWVITSCDLQMCVSISLGVSLSDSTSQTQGQNNRTLGKPIVQNWVPKTNVEGEIGPVLAQPHNSGENKQ